MDVITRLRDRIIICGRDSNLYETDVTGIVNAILELSGKTFTNGYVIKNEVALGSLGLGVARRVALSRSDITVFRDDIRDTVILEVLIKSTNQV